MNLKDYLDKLISTLLAFFTDVSTQVKLNADIPPINVDIELAAPMGLIINELVTNSYKYAFTERGHGEIMSRVN